VNLLVRKIIYDYMYPVDLENNEKSCEYSAIQYGSPGYTYRDAKVCAAFLVLNLHTDTVRKKSAIFFL
jgi:hypothetical protein